jgi:hypothetical protein
MDNECEYGGEAVIITNNGCMTYEPREYACPACGCIYNNEDEAEECYKSHD